MTSDREDKKVWIGTKCKYVIVHKEPTVQSLGFLQAVNLLSWFAKF